MKKHGESQTDRQRQREGRGRTNHQLLTDACLPPPAHQKFSFTKFASQTRVSSFSCWNSFSVVISPPAPRFSPP